jgi:hypothetical protein
MDFSLAGWAILILFLLLAAAATLLGIRTWVASQIKASVQSEYDHRLEVHKADLARQSSIELENLKSQLSIAAAERHLRLAR